MTTLSHTTVIHQWLQVRRSALNCLTLENETALCCTYRLFLHELEFDTVLCYAVPYCLLWSAAQKWLACSIRSQTGTNLSPKGPPRVYMVLADAPISGARKLSLGVDTGGPTVAVS